MEDMVVYRGWLGFPHLNFVFKLLKALESLWSGVCDQACGRTDPTYNSRFL